MANRSTSDPLNNQQIEILFHEIETLLSYYPLSDDNQTTAKPTQLRPDQCRRLMARADQCIVKLDILASRIVLAEYYLVKFKSFREDLERFGFVVAGLIT